MPSTPILIVALVSGYLFTRNLTRTSYKIHRFNRAAQYLSIAFWGLALLSISYIIFSLLHYVRFTCLVDSHVSEFLNNDIKPFQDQNETSSYLWLSTITFILGLIPYKTIINLFRKKSSIINSLRNDMGEVDPFAQLIIDSRLTALPVLLTMDNEKVYVGYIDGKHDFRLDRKEVTLLPFMSGYRDKRHTIVFTTFYPQVENISITKNEGDYNINIFEKVLPCSDIKSASLFDIDIYVKHFLQSRKKRKKKKS